MNKVYLVWEVRPFFQPSLLRRILSTKEKAEKLVEELKNALDESEKPQYDDYGLVEGVEYKYYENDVE